MAVSGVVAASIVTDVVDFGCWRWCWCGGRRSGGSFDDGEIGSGRFS